MLWTAKHFIVNMLLIGLSMMASLAVVKSIPLLDSLALFILLIILIPLAFSWPLYRLFSLRPLILPICPHCKNRHANYHISCMKEESSWVLICYHCGKPLRIVLEGKMDFEVNSDLPTLILQWPKCLGIWKRITTMQDCEVVKEASDIDVNGTEERVQ